MVDAARAQPDRHDQGEAGRATLGTDRAIASVAGQPILAGDLERRTAALRRGSRARHIPPDGAASADLRRWIVRELVTEATLVHEARAAGLLGPDDGPAALTPAVIGRLVDGVSSTVAVEGAAVRAFYDRNPDRFRRPETRRISHAVLADEPAARGVAGRLATGESIQAAVGQVVAVSDGGSGRVRVEDGRDLRRGELVGPVEDAVFGAPAGRVVGPVRAEHGWHVARIEGVAAASEIDFEEASPAIEAELLAEARIRAFDVWLEERRAAIAVVDRDFEDPADPAHGAAIHRH